MTANISVCKEGYSHRDEWDESTDCIWQGVQDIHNYLSISLSSILLLWTLDYLIRKMILRMKKEDQIKFFLRDYLAIVIFSRSVIVIISSALRIGLDITIEDRYIIQYVLWLIDMSGFWLGLALILLIQITVFTGMYSFGKQMKILKRRISIFFMTILVLYLAYFYATSIAHMAGAINTYQPYFNIGVCVYASQLGCSFFIFGLIIKRYKTPVSTEFEEELKKIQNRILVICTLYMMIGNGTAVFVAVNVFNLIVWGSIQNLISYVLSHAVFFIAFFLFNHWKINSTRRDSSSNGVSMTLPSITIDPSEIENSN